MTTITNLSHDGRGICHLNDKVTFVDNALPAEEVKIELIKQRSQYNEAKAVEIITASTNRVEPKCPYFGLCGGCSLQHMNQATQLELKQNILIEQLKHFGGIEANTILPPLISPSYGYRHKARLGVKYVNKKEKLLIGFREKNSRYLAEMDSCAILHPTVGLKLTELAQLIQSLSNYHDIPQIEVAVAENTTALIVRHLTPFKTDDLDKLTAFGDQHGFQFYLQSGGPETVEPLQQSKPLQYTLETGRHRDLPLQLLFRPGDFTQINPSINQQMVERAIELLEPDENDTILDLFCGLGNFTLPLARYCGQIVGIEGSEQMVQRAKNNAIHNDIDNAEFYCADLSQDCSNEPWSKQRYNKALLDPPRTGALEMVNYLLTKQPEKILYISCNPATLARDAGILCQNGYELSATGIMDMFPHTKHVESLGIFQRCYC